MASLLPPPPRTPSPKIRIHRSQSFDSPSSRISVTPIDDSPYSKSASAIIPNPHLPRYDALKAAERSTTHTRRRAPITLHTKLSDESMDMSSSTSSASDSEDSDSSSLYPASTASNSPSSPSTRFLPPSASSIQPPPPPPQLHTHVPPATLLPYQDPTTPSHNPWLVRVVLDMYDVRGFDWTCIAEPVERVWGLRTSSAEVLGILCGNGRIGRMWWD